MTLKNFIPLRRELKNHWIYQDNDYLKVWIEMLFIARFSKEPKKELHRGSVYIIKRGEFLFSRTTWSQRLKIKPHKLRKVIDLMREDNMITEVGKVGSGGATIYKISRYEYYNSSAEFEEHSKIEEEEKLNEDVHERGNQETKNNQAVSVDSIEIESSKGTEKTINSTQMSQEHDINVPKTDFKDALNSPLKKNVKKDKNVEEGCKKEKKDKKETIKTTIGAYAPGGELNKVLFDFVEMRRTIRKPLTVRALKMILNKLDQLADNEYTKIKILEQSIVHSWQTVYELKANSYRQNKANKDISDEEFNRWIES